MKGKKCCLKQKQIAEYGEFLKQAEKSRPTVEKYLRDVRMFFNFLPVEKEVTKKAMLDFKEYLSGRYSPSSLNSMLVAVNGFLGYLGLQEWRLRLVKTQGRLFRPTEKELTKAEYYRLLRACKGRKQLNLIMQTICSTGIRVGELQYITVESVGRGYAEVCCKGKVRTVLIPKELRVLLRGYMRERNCERGPVFVTGKGKPVDRSNIWREMKRLCQEAGVAEGKVFPHNLRHLFARTFYNYKKDLVKLADVLGHSNIETTRIYTISTGREHAKQLDNLGLVRTGK